MDAVEVLLRLLLTDLSLPNTVRLELIVHESKLNWRQANPTVLDKVHDLPASLIHDGPFRGRLVEVGRIREELALIAGHLSGSEVISVTSRLFNADSRPIGHLAIMNLHPEGFDDVDSLARAIEKVTDGMLGYLLNSGRYYHFYGRRVLHGEEWLTLLSRFLMPCVMVSPRYIGHSFVPGFLRRTPDVSGSLQTGRPHPAQGRLNSSDRRHRPARYPDERGPAGWGGHRADCGGLRVGRAEHHDLICHESTS
jgi:hypothetical protein